MVAPAVETRPSGAEKSPTSKRSNPEVIAAFGLGLVFLSQIAVPIGDGDFNIPFAVWDTLARKPRFRGKAPGIVEHILLIIGRFVTMFEALGNNHMTGGTGANPATSMVDVKVVSHGDIENASGKAGSAKGDHVWANFEDLFPG